MTSDYEHDAFEIQFEEAVQKAHKHTDRGDVPSGRTWTSIRSQLGNPSQAETADPRAFGRDREVVHSTVERNNNMDATFMPRTFDGLQKPSRRFGWMSVLAAGLVGLMIVTSLWMSGGMPPQDNGIDLAWAPGMGTALPSIGLASPVTSPQAITYGPGYACTVEPLTTNEVLDTVLNPERGYVRLGGEGIFPDDDYQESRGTNGVITLDVRNHFQPAGDADAALEASEAADQFWNCLMTGTAYQVWALSSPELVQSEVLLNLPVVRTEEDIIHFIEEWGPRRYSAGLGLIWPDLGGLDPIQITMRANMNPSEVKMASTSINGAENDLALVPLFPLPESNSSQLNYAELTMRKHPNGQWIITGYGFPNAGG